MSLSRRLPLVCSLLLALLSVAVSPVVAEEMTETVLANGMRVVLRPVHDNPVICTSVLVRAGVAWEPEGLSGASHFLEHLLFNGTTTRTQEQLYADVDRIGAYNNATTRADHTLYLLLAPSEHLVAALEIQADMLLHSTLPEDKFEKEKGIVLEEMGRSANEPSNLADEFFDQQRYHGTPYARPVLGTVESIRGLAREAVLAYYRERYVPSRMVLLLAGDFEPEAALALIRSTFGGGTVDREPMQPDTAMPRATIPFAAPASVHHQRVEAGRTYLRAAFPAPAEGDPDATAFGLLTELLGGGSSAPLALALKGGAEPAVFDYGLGHDTTGGAGALVLTATLTGARTPEEVVRLAADSMIDAVRQRQLDPEDLRLLRETRLTEDATLEEQLHYYALFRAQRLLQATTEQLRARAERSESVDIEAFDRLLRSYLVPLRAVISVSGPDEQPASVTQLDLSAIRFEPAAAAKAATTEIVVLDNGLTLAVGAEPGASVFAAHLIARNRSALEPQGRAGLADLVHHLLLRGTLARDAAALDQELKSVGANVKFHDDPRLPFDDYRTSPAYSFAIVEARSEMATETLRVLAEILQTPRFDPEEIASAAAMLGDLAERGQESSRTVSEQLFLEAVAPGHALSRPVAGTASSLDGVTREEVVAMYQRLFAPQNLILTIRGGGSPAALVRRAGEIFGGPAPGGGWALGGAPSEQQLPTRLIAPPEGTAEPKRAEVEVGKRQSYLRLGGVLDVREEDRVALAVATLVLSDRLQLDLRERQGLAYSLGADLSPVGGGRELFLISMGTAPDNLERAESEIRRVASELRAVAVPGDELEKVVAARKGRILMRRLPAQNQAMYDGLDLLYGQPSSGSLDFLEAMGRITPDQVRRAAERYLVPETWAIAVAK